MRNVAYPPPLPKPETLRVKSNARKSEWYPYAVIALLFSPSLWWIACDRRPFGWDQSLYAVYSMDLWYTLTHHPSLWPQAMLQSFGGITPGTFWLGQLFVPIGKAFGYVEFGLLVLILAINICNSVLTYQIGRHLCPQKLAVPLLGAVFVASAPLAIGVSHLYFSESLQLLAVTYCYWVALRAPNLSFGRLLIHVLLSLSAAMLPKASNLLYCIFPISISTIYLLRSLVAKPAHARRSAVQSAFPITMSCFIAGTAAAWYAFNFNEILRYVQYASISTEALRFGKHDSLGNKLLVWLGFIPDSFLAPQFLWPVAIILFACGVIVLSKLRKNRGGAGDFHRLLFTVAALAQIGVVLICCSSVIVEVPRYLVALLPSVVILLIRIVYGTSNNVITGILLALFLLQAGLVQGQALGLLPLASGPLPRYWQLKVIDSDPSRGAELRRLAELTAPDGVSPRTTVCGVEYRWLNNNTLSLFAAKQCPDPKRRSRYDVLLRGETNVDAAWADLMSKDFDFFVSVDEDRQERPVNEFNQVSAAILGRIRKDSHFVKVPFESKFGITVWRRTDNKRLSQATAAKIIAEAKPNLRDIKFADKFIARGIVTEILPHAMKISIVWESAQAQPLDFINAVHLLDSGGKIKSQLDYVQNAKHEMVSKGSQWKDEIVVPADKLRGASHVGICLYKVDQTPLAIDHGPTDWDKHRLLIAIEP